MVLKIELNQLVQSKKNKKLVMKSAIQPKNWLVKKSIKKLINQEKIDQTVWIGHDSHGHGWTGFYFFKKLFHLKFNISNNQI